MDDKKLDRTVLLVRLLRQVDSIIRGAQQLERDRDELRKMADQSSTGELLEGAER